MGTARDDQAGLRVSTEGLGQHPGQLRLAIGDMIRVSRRKRLDDFAQRRQRLVDALGFVEGLPFRPSLGDPLRAGQIDEVKLAYLA